MAINIFGKDFTVPFFAAPIGGMSFNYTDYLTEEELDEIYNFYSSEISDYSYSYLFYNLDYTNLIKASFWVVTIEILICATLMFFIQYFLFPVFIFKRGRQKHHQAHPWNS